MSEPKRKKESIEYITIENESDLIDKLEKGELEVKKPLDKHLVKFKAPYYKTIHIIYHGEKIVQNRFQCSLCRKLFHVDRKVNVTNQLSRHACLANPTKVSADENSLNTEVPATDGQNSQSENVVMKLHKWKQPKVASRIANLYLPRAKILSQMF